jgi:hypothetical protein
MGKSRNIGLVSGEEVLFKEKRLSRRIGRVYQGSEGRKRGLVPLVPF